MTSIAVAAMVCSRGESLAVQINQMKLFNAIATAAVIGASLNATAIPASAQSTRCSTDMFGTTTCRGSDGSRMRMTNDGFGGTNLRGTTPSGSS
jgi:hypothetical protein